MMVTVQGYFIFTASTGSGELMGMKSWSIVFKTEFSLRLLC